MGRAGVLVLVGFMLVVCGCDRLRWAPSEAIRQNSVLQQRTTTAMVWQAKQEQASPAALPYWLPGLDQFVPVLVVLAVLVIAKHHANIRRLLRGEEPRIGGSHSQDDSET